MSPEAKLALVRALLESAGNVAVEPGANPMEAVLELQRITGQALEIIDGNEKGPGLSTEAS